MTKDPEGQSDIKHNNVYGFKQHLLHMIFDAKKQIASLERLVHSQEVILNDATRQAVYQELISDLRREKGNAAYEAAYQVAGMDDLVHKIEGWMSYITKYGWASKFTVDGEKLLMTLEDKVDAAYIRDGARGVVEFMSK